MSKPNVPTIPGDILQFYERQLYRELSHMFEWHNLPKSIPVDYLETQLVKTGKVMFYYDDLIGHDVLMCEATGYNRHNLPTQARAFTPNTEGQETMVERNIVWLSDGELTEFDKEKSCVLIRNREDGQGMRDIVEHYAHRLALTQIALDTNLVWANIPFYFQVDSDEMRISIEKMFANLLTGKPFIMVDKYLFKDNQDKTGLPTDIPFIAKEIMDVRNEIMMKFREDVGIDTTGVDKAERVGKFEVDSNKQYTKTVLQIMLEQRQIACENINHFFGLDISVSVVGQEFLDHEEGGGEDGEGDGGTTPPTED